MNFDYCFWYWKIKASKQIRTLTENTSASPWTPPQRLLVTPSPHCRLHSVPSGRAWDAQEVELSHWGFYSVAPVWSPSLAAVICPSWLPLGPCLGSYLLLPHLELLPCSGRLVLLQHFSCSTVPPSIKYFLFLPCSCSGISPALAPWLMSPLFLSVPPVLASPLCLLLYVLLLSCCFFSLFQLWCCFSLHLSPFLKYASAEASETPLPGSALVHGGSVLPILEPAGTAVQHRAVPDLLQQRPPLQHPTTNRLTAMPIAILSQYWMLVI